MSSFSFFSANPRAAWMVALFMVTVGCKGMLKVSAKETGIDDESSDPPILVTTPTATPDPCAGGSTAPVLVTKHIAGRPGATVSINASGTRSNQKLRFRNMAAQIVSSVSVDGSGNVVLPSKAGQYQVELRDDCNQQISYGLATINDTSSGFAANAAHVLTYTHHSYRVWPDASLAVGDYNNDGKDDAAMASGNNGLDNSVNGAGVYLYKFDSGLGRMVLDTNIPETLQASGLKFADFNNDGYLDLVWANNGIAAGNGKMRIAMGSASGFSAPTHLAIPAMVAVGEKLTYDIEVNDIDRDGDVDIVTAGGVLNGGVTWTSGFYALFKNNGSGTFTSSAIETGVAYPAGGVQLADANDDGRLDIYAYIGNPTPRLYRILQKADGSFSIAVENTDFYATAPVNGNFPFDSIRIGYLNSDNKPDAIVSHADGPSGVFYSSASDLTMSAGSIPTFADQHGARGALADLNADGEMEYYLPLKNRALFANKGGIMRKVASNLTSSVSPSAGNTIVGAVTVAGWSQTAMVMGDYNGDGKVDIFMPITYTKQIEVLYGN